MGALIAAAGITAAGAIAGGAMSMSAADKAAKAQGRASKKAAKQQAAALKKFEEGKAKVEAEIGKIKAPVYNYAAMQRDALAESQFRRAQALGGEAQYEALRKQALANISQGLAGQLTEAELGAVRREQAFLQGAGFNPAMAGRGAIQQRGQYDYLRAIGQTAGGAIERAGNLFGQWTNIASAYIADPKQYGALQYQYGMGGASVGLDKVGIKSDLLKTQYEAQTGAAQQELTRQNENIRTSLAAREAGAEAVRGASSAIGSGITSGYGAYNQYNTAKNPSTVSGYGGQQYARQTSASGNVSYAPIGGFNF